MQIFNEQYAILNEKYEQMKKYKDLFSTLSQEDKQVSQKRYEQQPQNYQQ